MEALGEAHLRATTAWRMLAHGKRTLPLSVLDQHSAALEAAGWSRGLTSLLREFDDDNDGSINAGEFETALAYAVHASSFDAGGAFATVDLNERDADELVDLRAQMRQTFDAIDANGDGSLSTSEVAVNWSKLRALGLRTPAPPMTVAEVLVPFLSRTDASLSIDFATFERALAFYQDVRAEDSAREVGALAEARSRARALFDRCDPDGSGFVLLDDVGDADDARFAAAGLTAPIFGWRSLLRLWDADGSAMVSCDEFEAAVAHCIAPSSSASSARRDPPLASVADVRRARERIRRLFDSARRHADEVIEIDGIGARIDSAEIEVAGIHWPSRGLVAVLASFDEDADGMLSYHEFEAAASYYYRHGDAGAANARFENERRGAAPPTEGVRRPSKLPPPRAQARGRNAPPRNLVGSGGGDDSPPCFDADDATDARIFVNGARHDGAPHDDSDERGEFFFYVPLHFTRILLTV
jgi:Ca2+-binding EF-hand superfamily protein